MLAGLFRDSEQTEVVEMKAQPSMDKDNDNEEDDEEDHEENENKKTLSRPSVSEWQSFGASRASGMQLWTPGVQLSGCRMSLMSKRLLQQTGADVSGVIVPTAPSDKKSSIESKYETDLPKLTPSELNSTHSVPTSASASLSSSQSVSTSSSTLMSSSSGSLTISTPIPSAHSTSLSSSSSSRSSTTTSSSSSTAVLTTPGGPGLMPRPLVLSLS